GPARWRRRTPCPAGPGGPAHPGRAGWSCRTPRGRGPVRPREPPVLADLFEDVRLALGGEQQGPRSGSLTLGRCHSAAPTARRSTQPHTATSGERAAVRRAGTAAALLACSADAPGHRGAPSTRIVRHVPAGEGIDGSWPLS